VTPPPVAPPEKVAVTPPPVSPPEKVAATPPVVEKPAQPEKTPERHTARPNPPPRPTPRPVVKPEQRPAGNFGFLRVNSKPWTKIFVDGMDTNLNTPQTAYQMSPGMHQIMLFNPEFGIRETFSVHIIAGETQTVIKDFRK
jgi:hypothetical protein